MPQPKGTTDIQSVAPIDELAHFEFRDLEIRV